MYDDIHLRRNHPTRERISGVKLYIQNIYQALVNKALDPQFIQHALRKTVKRNRPGNEWLAIALPRARTRQYLFRCAVIACAKLYVTS